MRPDPSRTGPSRAIRVKRRCGVTPGPRSATNDTGERAATAGSGSGSGGQQASGGWWWWGPWYEHQNLRDERAEAFASLLWEGVHIYSYVARATTPGAFVVPPTKAEEMYHPETFGRGAGDKLVVDDVQ